MKELNEHNLPYQARKIIAVLSPWGELQGIHSWDTKEL
jgi:hypothetical protein